MSLREHILESSSDGYVTKIVKQTRYGTFSSTVRCHEEDQDVFNSVYGSTLAEYKCDLQSLHKQVVMMEQRAIGAMNVYKGLLQSIPEDNEMMIKVKRQANIARRDADNLREKYKDFKSNYKKYAEIRNAEARRVKEILSERASE